MNDTVIFFVLAALALIFKWLTSKGSDEAEKPPPSSPNEPIRRAPPLTEEERVRRFLEALGVPAGTQPPPPVRPRSVTPRPVAPPAPRAEPPRVKRSWAQPLPPVTTQPEEMPLPPVTTAPLPEPVLVMETAPPPVADVPPPLPAESIPRPLVRTAMPPSIHPMMSLRPLLRSREKIRQAIILREVLGPPRGLEPLGHFPGQ